MTNARLDGLRFMLLGCLTFILLGTAMEETSDARMKDFRAIYISTRCLMQHSDPYRESEVLRVSRAEGTIYPSDTGMGQQIITRSMYLPSTFSFAVPFAMLPWGPAHLLWMALTMGSLIFASFLMWNVGANYAPVLSGALIGFLLANSEVVIIFGNTAGLAVSLCVVAVWCFLCERFVPAGIVCLAISLAIKPHDAGLVWLYFFLAGGVFRKRAWQTLLATVALSLPGVLWAWRVSPHWMQELHSNIQAFAVHGGLCDPSPASMGPHGLGAMINLQTAFSIFRDDPHFYNLASYLVCTPLLLVWAFVALRSRPSPARAWISLAAIATLTMLPIYHRQYDAKLLLLTVPACAMLWSEGGLIRWFALAVNSASLVWTADIPWMILGGFIKSLRLSETGHSGQILRSAMAFPAPFLLLAMSIFYLWVYVSRSSAAAESAESENSGELPNALGNTDSGLKLNRPLHRRISRLPAVPDRKSEWS